MDEPALIEIRNLSIGFRSHGDTTLEVLRNIDLQVRRGETVGLVGESGSGKSTLALAGEPQALLLDEPTTGLDVTTQAHILKLLRELGDGTGTAMVYVSHDLGAIARVCHRVSVMYAGEVVQEGDIRQVFKNPAHPYTEVLLGAVLEPDPDTAPVLIADDVIELSPPAKGCPFQRRCPRRVGTLCDTQAPPWHKTRAGHSIRCHIPLTELHRGQLEGARIPPQT